MGRSKRFVEYVEMLRRKKKSGELYKNLDEMQMIITVMRMIDMRDSLMKLQGLEESEKEEDQKMYKYYSDAIYNKRSNSEILDLYTDPERILGMDDITFIGLKEVHEKKKPINMVTRFPYLDFEAKDLVECLGL